MKNRKARVPAEPSSGWRDLETMPAIVFLLALVVRIVYLAQTAGDPTFGPPLFDAQGYCARADDWIRGHGLNPEVFEFSLGYHLFLSACFFLTDGSVAFARGAQAVLGALVCAGAAWAALRLFGRKAGWIAGLLAACYGPAILLDFQLIPATLECAWCAALLLLAIPAPPDGRCRFLSGIMGGSGLLLSGRYFAVWLVICAVNRFGEMPEAHPAGARRAPYRLLLGLAIPLVAALALFLSGLRLDKTRDRFGAEAYLANSGDLCRTLTLRPGPDYLDFLETTEVAARQRHLGRGPYLLRETAVQIGRHPVRFLQDLGVKILHLACSREIPGTFDVRVYRDGSPLARILLWEKLGFGFPFGIVLALAAAGVAARRPRRLLAATATLGLALVLLRVTSPARMPWIVFLFPLAGAGACALAGIRDGLPPNRKPAAWTAALAALLLSWLPGPFCVEQGGGRAELYDALGQDCLHRSDPGNARRYFMLALAENPADARAWNGLGAGWQIEGRLDEAQRCFERSIAAKPRYALAVFNLAKLQALQGRPETATALFEQGLALQPLNDQAQNDLGRLWLRQGQPERARDHFLAARDRNPAVLDIRLNLAEAWLALGENERATAELQTAAQMDPRHPRVFALLGMAMLRADLDREAEGYFLAAQRLGRGEAEPAYGLALLAARRGETNAAYAHYATGLARDRGAGLALLTTNEQAVLRKLQPP